MLRCLIPKIAARISGTIRQMNTFEPATATCSFMYLRHKPALLQTTARGSLGAAEYAELERLIGLPGRRVNVPPCIHKLERAPKGLAKRR